MSNPIATANNALGPVLYARGKSRRMSSWAVTYKGVDLEVLGFMEGAWLAATANEPGEAPTCDARFVHCHGTDITKLLSDDAMYEIAQAVEVSWDLNGVGVDDEC